MLLRRATLSLLALLLTAAGCASDSTGRHDPAQDSSAPYAATFDAARAVLRDEGFILERVDARAGVITTRPKTTAGIATPWHTEQSSFNQELEDLVQRHQRVVRITFKPADSRPPAADSPADFQVQVTLQRLHAPGRRLEPEALRQTSFATDPALVERAMQPTYAVAWKQDRLLAERLTTLIRARAYPN